ncbi:MAG: VanW family protein [Anaerolineales bacterium]|nr:VanW family protein [Anaerolineales bacterium]
MVTQPLSQPSFELPRPSWFSRVLAAVVAALGVVAAVALLFSLVISLFNLGKVMPGVRVAGMDLSGVGRREAIALLSQQLTFSHTGKVTLRYGERSWQFTPAQLGLHLDAEASAGAAYGFGRSLWPWENIAQKMQTLQGGADLAPRLIFDGQVAHLVLQQIAAEINQPTIEAQLSLQELHVSMSPGQVGLSLDSEKTVTWLAAQLMQMQDVDVPLAVEETPPRILDVSAQAAIAENLLGQPLVIAPGGDYEDNPDPWTLEPETLAGLLSVERVEGLDGAHYQLGLNSQELGAILASLGSKVSAQPRNARFVFNDETRQLDIYKPAVIGRTLNLQASIEHINNQIGQGAHQVELQYDYTEPGILNSISAEELGIRELVSEQTTYFYGSSDERIQNIAISAERFHGLLVAPGEVFSMVENIGDISLESGFAEALIIFGDRTIKGVGGGVCQVSTTLFRTVFFGGFPIVERYPHAYRVGYYEMDAAGNTRTNLAGLDAAIFAPIVDFKFRNDTPHWLLMETYVNRAARTITWKFYSTYDGRTVDWDTSGTRNIVDAPDPVYEENAELGRGEVKQVDWSADGATVSVVRTVTRNGEVIHQDQINTQYQAWAAVYQYGPGTPNMPPRQIQGN